MHIENIKLAIQTLTNNLREHSTSFSFTKNTPLLYLWPIYEALLIVLNVHSKSDIIKNYKIKHKRNKIYKAKLLFC